MKKKIVSRLGLIALTVAAVVTTTVVAVTAAKYLTETKGPDQNATVASFAFDLNDTAVTAANASTAIDTSNLFSGSYLNGKVDGGSTNVVAPGTSGKVLIKLENKGKVAIAPVFSVESSGTAIPLQFAITESETAPADVNAWKSALTGDDKVSMTALSVGSAAKTYYLHWRWNPSSTDVADTALGTAESPATATVKISCTVSQVVA